MNARTEILLIDDNASGIKLALHTLATLKPREKIALAREGQEALEIFSEWNKERVTVSLKLILLDLKLPKVNGFEVLRAIRHSQYWRLIPVVIFSSSNQERDLRESYRLGANSYVQKPVDFEHFQTLTKTIEQYWLPVNYAPPPLEEAN